LNIKGPAVCLQHSHWLIRSTTLRLNNRDRNSAAGNTVRLRQGSYAFGLLLVVESNFVSSYQ
jgi:hypothetical protein